MANEQQWTKERQANAKDSLDKLGWPLTEIETRAMLAEIERAWGEIADARSLADECGTEIKIEREKRELAERRMRHAHDAASALYRAASLALDTDTEKGDTIPNIIVWFRDLKADEDDTDIETGCEALEHVAARLSTAIDPALSAAALAETQRRDGLEGEVKRLTAQLVDEHARGMEIASDHQDQLALKERQIGRLNTTLTNVWNALATALIELDHDPSKDAEEMAKQAADVIVGTLSRGPIIGQEIDLSDGRKATITEAWSNGAGWYVDVRHPDGSKGRMVSEGGAWRESHGRPETRPALTPEQAREAVEAILYVPGRSPFAMAGPLVKLLMRVASPETPEQASMALAFAVVGEDAGGGPTVCADKYCAECVNARRAYADRMRSEQGETPPPEMVTTTGEADGDEGEGPSELRTRIDALTDEIKAAEPHPLDIARDLRRERSALVRAEREYYSIAPVKVATVAALAFLRWVCGMVPVERCRCGAPATVTDCTTLGEHGAFYCAAHLGECDMRGTWIATGKRVWTDRGEAVSQ